MLTDVMSDRFLVRDTRSVPGVCDRPRLLGQTPQVPGERGQTADRHDTDKRHSTSQLATPVRSLAWSPEGLALRIASPPPAYPQNDVLFHVLAGVFDHERSGSGRLRAPCQHQKLCCA